MKHLFLDFDRPLTRKEWWKAQGIILAAGNIAVLLMAWDRIISGEELRLIMHDPQIQLAMLALLLIGLLPTIKRYKALGRSGWRALLVFVPFFGPVLQLYECGILEESDHESAVAEGRTPGTSG